MLGLELRSCSAVIMSAMGQPASGSGSSTVFWGDRIAAVSAMNRTPQKTITSASVLEAWMLRPSESPQKSARFWISAGW